MVDIFSLSYCLKSHFALVTNDIHFVPTRLVPLGFSIVNILTYVYKVQ